MSKSTIWINSLLKDKMGLDMLMNRSVYNRNILICDIAVRNYIYRWNVIMVTIKLLRYYCALWVWWEINNWNNLVLLKKIQMSRITT